MTHDADPWIAYRQEHGAKDAERIAQSRAWQKARIAARADSFWERFDARCALASDSTYQRKAGIAALRDAIRAAKTRRVK